MAVTPAFWGDEAQRRRVARHHAELWAELREEELGSEELAWHLDAGDEEHKGLGGGVCHFCQHWMYEVIELGAAAPFDDDPRAWLYGDHTAEALAEWRAGMAEVEERKAALVREEWAALMGTA